MSDLKEPLMTQATGQLFQVDKDKLCKIFEQDSRRSDLVDEDGLNESTKIYNSLGGKDGLLRALKTDEKTGLREDDALDLQSRARAFGENTKRIVPTKALCEIICEQFKDRILQILLIAATFSLIVGVYKEAALLGSFIEGLKKGWIEGCTIYIAVIIIVGVTTFNDYAKEKQFQQLLASREDRDIQAVRNGNPIQISIYKLLVGDIIPIFEGDKLVTDCVLLEGTNLTADESNLTGEPDHMKKEHLTDQNITQNPDAYLLSGSQIMSGKGKAVILAVGSNTVSGRTQEMLEQEATATPLQVKLERIADEIGKVGVYCALLTFTACTVNLIISTVSNNEPFFDIKVVDQLVIFLILAITIVVVAVPEGLPMAVTISLAYSVHKMKEEQNLVRQLSASETMGGAQEICTDKTGTLTMNKMTVVELYAQGNITHHMNDFSQTTKDIIVESVAVNSTANLIWDKDTNKEIRAGNQTECGLIELIKNNGSDYRAIRESKKELFSIPFSSQRKRMSIIVPHSDEGFVRMYTKGASEIILERCTNWINEEGEVDTLEAQKKKEIEYTVIEKFAHSAYRTLTMAYKDIPMRDFTPTEWDESTDIEDDLTLIAIFGIQDPLRPEIIGAMKACDEAGINVRMVTGDNITTAIAISKNAGILPQAATFEKYACMEGKEFRSLVGGLVDEKNDRGETVQRLENMDTFIEIQKHLRVLARSSPSDKYLLVTGLKYMNKCVAVTGDGTNDAPALKKADVGFAMGITGSEVAKEAADIILLDDNFSSIITAVKWGRNIYNSVRKFLQFQLTVNVVAMFIAFIGGVVLGESPITSVQMLWVNLIMDTFAALALATEPPSDDLLKEKPYGKDENIVNSLMWRNILGQAFYQIVVLCLLLFAGDTWFGWQTKANSDKWTVENGLHYTMVFNTFVFMQIFNEINARKIKAGELNVFAQFFNNALFMIIEIGTIGVQILIVQKGGEFIKCSPLTWQNQLICVGIGAFSLVWGLLIKILPFGMFSFVLKQTPMTEKEQLRSSQTWRKGTSSGPGLSRGLSNRGGIN